jgi:hypothetical protein
MGSGPAFISESAIVAPSCLYIRSQASATSRIEPAKQESFSTSAKKLLADVLEPRKAAYIDNSPPKDMASEHRKSHIINFPQVTPRGLIGIDGSFMVAAWAKAEDSEKWFQNVSKVQIQRQPIMHKLINS